MKRLALVLMLIITLLAAAWIGMRFETIKDVLTDKPGGFTTKKDSSVPAGKWTFLAMSELAGYNLKINDKEALSKAVEGFSYTYSRHKLSDKQGKVGGVEVVLSNQPEVSHIVKGENGEIVQSGGFGYDAKRNLLQVRIKYSENGLKHLL